MSRRGRGDFSFPPDQPEGRMDIDQILQSLGGGLGGRLRTLLGGIGFWGILLAVGLLWLGTGTYQVDPASQAIVRLFGLPQAPVGEGLHWRWPAPIGQLDIVRVREVKSMELGFRTIDPGPPARTAPQSVEALMITGDENIVDVEIVVQYRIKDIVAFLFNVSDPGDPDRRIRDRPDGRTLRDAAEAALRQVAGSRTLDDVLTVERVAVENETHELLQSLLDIYGAGLFIERVQVQVVKPPEQVQAAFLDVVSAKEQKEQLINQAKAYEADIIPKAQGEAQQMIRAAEAFRAARIAGAEGDSARFLSVLAQYKKSQDVTRRRLYLETVEQVLPEIKKFIIAPNSGNVVQLLPLEEFQTPLSKPAAAAPSTQPGTPPTPGRSGSR